MIGEAKSTGLKKFYSTVSDTFGPEYMATILENLERSLIIINEMLSSTTLKDGIEIGRNIIDKIKKMK